MYTYIYIYIYIYLQNVLSTTIRDLKILESSGFHQNVYLSSLSLGILFQILKILPKKRESVIINFV